MGRRGGKWHAMKVYFSSPHHPHASRGTTQTSLIQKYCQVGEYACHVQSTPEQALGHEAVAMCRLAVQVASSIERVQCLVHARIEFGPDRFLRDCVWEAWGLMK